MLNTLLKGAAARLPKRPPVIDEGDWDGMVRGLRLLRSIGVAPATIIDVGASDGRWARDALSVFPEARLVLCEPQPVHGDALNQFSFDHPQARVVRSAIGASAGDVSFDASKPLGGVIQKEATASSITVPVVTLDDEIAEPAPFLVKLDTHGVEMDILAGAQDVLERSTAWIIEAYNHRLRGDADVPLFWELCAYMAEHGFRPVNLAGVMPRAHDKTLWQMDIFFVRSSSECFAYFKYL